MLKSVSPTYGCLHVHSTYRMMLHVEMYCNQLYIRMLYVNALLLRLRLFRSHMENDYILYFALPPAFTSISAGGAGEHEDYGCTPCDLKLENLIY